MTHLALYREWRPRTFDEIVEQKHAVYALRQAVISGQIAHAYLFSGTRGTGKTTLAKVFSRAINCLNPEQGNPCNTCEICRGILNGSLLDVLEIDAASNNSVDNIRRICDEVVFMPSQAKYKVYIIDEVHMLSTGAFNALLKTLEEPPAHAVFILATTEPHRIPATILSRCQRYEFRRLPVASMVQRLVKIASADGIDIDSDALQTIASLADGALRDAISLLDQARNSVAGKIARDDVLALAGVVHDDFMIRVSDAMLENDTGALLLLVDQLVMDGRDLARFVTDLAQHFRNLLVCGVADDPASLLRVSSESLQALKLASQNTDQQALIEIIRGLSALLSDLRWAADARTALEIGLIRITGSSDQKKTNIKTNVKPAVAKKEAASSAARQEPDRTGIPGQPAPQDRQPLGQAEAEPPPAAPPRDEDFSGESAPAEIADSKENEAAPEVRESARIDNNQASAIWQASLQNLQENGQMTLYLFSRPAKPQISGDILELYFAAAEKLNFKEVSQTENIKLLNDAVLMAAGQKLQVKPLLESSKAKPAAGKDKNEDWIGKIKTTADDLGIPLEIED